VAGATEFWIVKVELRDELSQTGRPRRSSPRTRPAPRERGSSLPPS
jgi:hypothetical protein